MSDDVTAFFRLRRAIETSDYTPPEVIAADCLTVMETVQKASEGADVMSSKGFPAGRVLIEVLMEHIIDEEGPRTLVSSAMVHMTDVTDENKAFIVQKPLDLDPDGHIEAVIRELRFK